MRRTAVKKSNGMSLVDRTIDYPECQRVLEKHEPATASAQSNSIDESVARIDAGSRGAAIPRGQPGDGAAVIMAAMGRTCSRRHRRYGRSP